MQIRPLQANTTCPTSLGSSRQQSDTQYSVTISTEALHTEDWELRGLSSFPASREKSASAKHRISGWPPRCAPTSPDLRRIPPEENKRVERLANGPMSLLKEHVTPLSASDWLHWEHKDVQAKYRAVLEATQAPQWVIQALLPHSPDPARTPPPPSTGEEAPQTLTDFPRTDAFRVRQTTTLTDSGGESKQITPSAKPKTSSVSPVGRDCWTWRPAAALLSFCSTLSLCFVGQDALSTFFYRLRMVIY